MGMGTPTAKYGLPLYSKRIRAGMSLATEVRSDSGRASRAKPTVSLAYQVPWYSTMGWAPSGVGSEPSRASILSALGSSVLLRTVRALVNARETAESSRCLSRFSRVSPNVVTARNVDSSAAPSA